MAAGLTPHGLRHTHKTLLVELGVARPLQDERLGHLDGTVQGRYSHVTQTMRDRLMSDLEEVWEQALELRRAMSPGSPVVALDRLLRSARGRGLTPPGESTRFSAEVGRVLMWDAS